MYHSGDAPKPHFVGAMGFETGSCYVPQAGLELEEILLSPKGQNYRRAPPPLVQVSILLK